MKLLLFLLLSLPLQAQIYVRILKSETSSFLEERINTFIKDKKIINIEYASSSYKAFGFRGFEYSALIVYEKGK
jgi:hypothetical protein